MKHAEAARHAQAALEYVFKRKPGAAERQILQGIAWLESRYGTGWKGAGVGSYNMGAIQAGRPPCDPAKAFEYTDTTPTSSGGSIPYRICFRKYPNPTAGFEDLVRIAYVRRPSVLSWAVAGDVYGVSKALRETVYYEGFGRTQDERIANHHRALKGSLVLICRALGEPLPDGSPVPPRTLRLTSPAPMMGADVLRAQKAIGAEQTGIFDRRMRAAVMAFQVGARGLKVDGVIGPQTWEAIETLERGATEPAEAPEDCSSFSDSDRPTKP